MIEIRNMEPADVPQVAQLEKENFSAPWSEKSIACELKNDLSLWLCARDGDAVVGYIGSQSVMGESDMMNVAVSSQYRRQGIGEQLVKELVNRLGGKDSHSLTLEVRMSNEPAKKLYEKLGFSQVGIRPGYYEKPREDALILRKEWNL